MLIASFKETEEIGRKVARALKAEYTTIYAKDFPDSEFHVKLKANPRHKEIVIINSLANDPDEKIIETLLVGGIARDYGVQEYKLAIRKFSYLLFCFIYCY